MAVIESVVTFGRISVFGNVSVILFTVNGNGVTYTSASGGLAIDLAAPLTQGAPFSQPYLNPADIIGVIPNAGGLSAGGYYADSLIVGTPTYTNPATYPFGGGSSSNVRPDLQLATCPATIRLHLATTGAQVADGANSDTGIVVALIVARGGTNVN